MEGLAFHQLGVLSIGIFCNLWAQSAACIGSFDMQKKVSSMLLALSVVA